MLFVGGLLASCGLVVSFGLNLLLFAVSGFWLLVLTYVWVFALGRSGGFVLRWLLGCLWFDVWMGLVLS